MKITKKEYEKMTKESTLSNSFSKNIIMAFIFGGAICTFGEFLNAIFMDLGLNMKLSRAAVAVSLVLLGALLTAFNVYDNIAKHAGAGTLVPITGFSNSIVAPAIEFKSEGHVTGLGVKMFVIAGPVLTFSTTAAIIYGLIIWIFKLF